MEASSKWAFSKDPLDASSLLSGPYYEIAGLFAIYLLPDISERIAKYLKTLLKHVSTLLQGSRGTCNVDQICM